MTARFRERELQQRLADLYVGPMPEYRDDVLKRVARTPQRPAWTFRERWLPRSVVTSRIATAPPIRWRTIAILGLLLIALVAGTVLVIGSQRQQLPPPFGPAANGSLLYSWEGDILTRETLSGKPRVLIGGDANDVGPEYAPDGTKFLFFRAGLESEIRPPPEADLWVANVDGSDPVKVGGPYPYCCWVDWSPAGDRIAVGYYDETAGQDVIDIVRSDGSGSSRLDVGMPVGMPAFRPTDGSQLLFRGRAIDGKGWALYLANGDGSSARRLTLLPDAGYGSDDDFVDPAWSPDGAHLAYVVVDAVEGAPGGTGQRIHVADIASDGTVTADERLTRTVDAEAEYSPLWLPTGDGIVYRQFRGTGEEVWDATVDGVRAPRYLGVSAGSGVPTTISPDGTQALALNTNTHLLSVIDLATGEVHQHFNAEDGVVFQRRALP
jgi:Tol biopolymer transport system component